MNSASRRSLEALRAASRGLDEALGALLAERARGEESSLYGMLSYFLGFADESLKPVAASAGKRFRPALCLFVADACGVRERATDAALAIELFHNFTLIHDDVEDRDETRRGRPTVWKLWGVNHAINSGDAQSVIAARLAARAGFGSGAALTYALLDTFAAVIEGQHLDFELAALPLDQATVERYVAMIEKKSGALVGVSAEAPGIIAALSAADIAALRRYGRALGTAYQVADDYSSVWDAQAKTGKDVHSDIRERKRTYPFLAAYARLSGDARARLAALYALERQLSPAEIDEVLSLLAHTDAKAETRALIELYSADARAAAAALSIADDAKAVLAGLVEALVTSA